MPLSKLMLEAAGTMQAGRENKSERHNNAANATYGNRELGSAAAQMGDSRWSHGAEIKTKKSFISTNFH
jgi:hypothetical protein